MSEYDFVKTKREDVKPLANSGKELARFRKGMKFYSSLNVWVYKISRGLLMNTAMGGYEICIVRMKGSRSGKMREIPLIHVPHGESKILVGSQAGLDRNPAWVYSVRKNPEVEIIAAGHRSTYLVREVSLDEKRALWPELLAVYPAYDEYQARTDRNIPVFLCEPRGPK
jgi:F420H(2)-dependent quinone reductase